MGETVLAPARLVYSLLLLLRKTSRFLTCLNLCIFANMPSVVARAFHMSRCKKTSHVLAESSREKTVVKFLGSIAKLRWD